MNLTKIIIEGTTVDRAMEIVRDLRAMGLVQGTDFDFAFYKVHDGWFNSSHTEFTFYDEKHASWFSLKWR